MIKTGGRQADRAYLAVGVVLNVQLVFKQAKLADEQHDNEQQSERPVRQVDGYRVLLVHRREGYT